MAEISRGKGNSLTVQTVLGKSVCKPIVVGYIKDLIRRHIDLVCLQLGQLGKLFLLRFLVQCTWDDGKSTIYREEKEILVCIFSFPRSVLIESVQKPQNVKSVHWLQWSKEMHGI